MRAYHLLFFSTFLPTIVWTQGPRIALESANYFVSEAVGSVTVCAVVNGGSLSSNVVVTITTLSSTATSPDDYASIDEQHTFTPGGPTTLCSDIQINSDDTVEMSETFSAGLQSSMDILESPTSAFILITDDSQLTLGLDQMEYFVTEGLRLQVCAVVLNGQTERSVSYEIRPGGGSASTISDYFDSTLIGTFQAGSGPGDQSCQHVVTFSDRAVENNETFLVELGSFDAVVVPDDVAVANIVDNDGAEVVWRETDVTVAERNNGDVNQTMLCIVLVDRDGGLRREVNFRLSSEAGTADNSDYVPLSDVILGFPASPSLQEGSSVCQTVTIIGDDIMEPDETFTVIMTPENSMDVIMGSTAVTITIPDDQDELVACPELSDPVDGEVVTTGVVAGSTATYACDNGYNIEGPLVRVCGSDGTWEDTEPSCQIVDCGSPPSPDNASPAATVTSTTFGTTVTYICDIGFMPTGEATITCEAGGSWSGDGPQCNAVDCGPLDDPANGNVDVPLTEFSGVATYTCVEGYVLSGGNTRTCQANEMWSGVAPTCSVVTCPVLVSPPNADVQHPQGVEYQSTATYTCDSGYERSSGDLQRDCSADGTWTGTEPVCVAVDCGPLNPPENGAVTLSGTTFTEVADYSCNSGYTISGIPNRQCMADGMWSGSRPSCTIVDCDVLPDPSNGQVVYTTMTTTFGSEAQYVCTAGCEPLGDSTRTCTADGTWSIPVPQCPDINCGGLSNPSNGIIQFSMASSAGGMVTYICNAGYEPVGGTTRECLCSGVWSGNEPTCQAVDCGVLEHPVNGMVVTTPGTAFLSEATYTCIEGYRLVGTATRMCEDTGVWSDSAPSCEIVTCPSLPDINNGNVDTADTVFNSVATYTCDEGYRLDGDMQRTCLSSESWSGAEPQCLFITCDLLDAPVNGVLFYTDSIFLNSVAIFDCNAGFNLIGTDARTCQENEEWTGQTPQCIEIVCGSLSSPDNGNVIVSGTGLGAEATYTCDTGYDMEGQNMRTCMNSADPQWSGSAPVCNIVSCPSLPDPDNGGIQFSSGSTYQSTADYSCVVGYSLTGPPALTCGANGQWSDAPPHCEIVVCPELNEPENGAIDYEDGLPPVFNSSAEYICASGYMLDGNRERLCRSDGTWSGSSPLCRPVDCGELSDPENGVVQLARTTFGGAAVYECNENYNLVGTSSARLCQADASWSGFPPTCELVDCGRPPFVFMSSFKPPETTVGTTITYTCFTGHRLVGEKDRICQADGQWSGNTPQCVGIECDELGDPLNGEVLVASVEFGGLAEYTCDVGFVLEGRSVRQCVGEGTWNGSAPLCRTVLCPALVAPNDGQVVQNSLEYESLAEYTCNEGYLLVGEAARLCLSDGTWSGETPECEPLDCGPLPDPRNGEVNAPSTILGSQASYTCLGSGYILTGDSSRQCGIDGLWTGSQPVCDNIDECENANGMCEQICADTDGSYICTCRVGYVEMDGNRLLCQDDNECDVDSGGCAHTCNNFEGGFNCSCDDNYVLSEDRSSCLDIDECDLGLHDCHPNATCSNTDGGFVCFCNIGFEGDGISCNNTDECVQSGSPCHEDAECTDTEGGFECQCRPGFIETGDTDCLNVNECETGNNCHPNATCTDTHGSYVCTCNDGNAGDGFICEAQCLTNFQLVLKPVDSCLNWRFDSTSAKLSDITVATVSRLNTMCSCSLPPSHVFANEFTCADNDAQEVIYRAVLQGVEARDCSNLTSHLREWIDAKSSVLIQGNRLQLNPACDLEIESLDIQPACVIGETPLPPTTSSPDSGGLSTEVIIGAVAAGAIIIVLLLLLIIVVCCICCRRRPDNNDKDKEAYSTLSQPFGHSSNYPLSASHSYNSMPSATPSRTRGVYDYNSDVDIKTSTTFEPGKMTRTPSIPLVDMTEGHRHSGVSSRSGSFSSIDPNELTYANMKDDKVEKFDDPVYEYIKGSEQDFADNPLYDRSKRTSL